MNEKKRTQTNKQKKRGKKAIGYEKNRIELK